LYPQLQIISPFFRGCVGGIVENLKNLSSRVEIPRRRMNEVGKVEVHFSFSCEKRKLVLTRCICLVFATKMKKSNLEKGD